ncbi:MAG: ATP-binding protein [Geminicoccaceae bacterium]
MPARPMERRQLTIMFTDLVDSTALSDSMDPEDLRLLIEAHRTAAVGPVKRYGGVVARYAGDGMLIFFGYPEAHEDDPDRAARAALEILDVTRTMNQRWIGEGHGRIKVRIGIHTGIVVVGDVLKADVRERMSVFGRAPNLAARLQTLAEPGQVLISGRTKALLRPSTRCHSRGRMTLRGIAEPIEIYSVVDIDGAPAGERLGTSGRKILPFVNRQKELAALKKCWASAKRGDGKAILVSGEAGIGKSRLIRAIEERILTRPFRWLMARTSPYATNSDFFAFSELFHTLLSDADGVNKSRAASESDADSVNKPVAARDAPFLLLQLVLQGQGMAEPEVAFGFATLLGVDIPESEKPPSLQPERLRELTLAAICRWFERQAELQPTILVIEDLHWADASTLETLKRLITVIPACRLLLIASSRDDALLEGGDAAIDALHVERLKPHDAQNLLGQVIGDTELPETAVATLLERAAGVPLFLEELPKPILEAGGTATLGSDSQPIIIPATLRDSLMAQLDRMGSAKIVAQIGAVIGHRFDEALIRRVWADSAKALEDGITALTDASLLNRRGDPPDATYDFKHALLAEIAYDSLLRQDRRQLHRQTADALVAHFPTLAEARPELIARHYAASDDANVAFDYWMKAGKAAARRSANTEAIGHLRSAEAELERLKAAGMEGLDERWLALHMARGPVLIALSGWSTQHVEETYRKAWTISQSIGAQPRDQFGALGGLYNVYVLRGDLVEARAAAEQVRKMSTDLGFDEVLPKWHSGVGYCDFLSGRFREAENHMDNVLKLYDAKLQTRHTTIYGTDPSTIARSIIAWSQWFSGKLHDARRSSTLAVEMSQRANHPFSQCYALCFAASLAQCQNEPHSALSIADSVLDFCKQHAFAYWPAWANIVKGWAISALGEPEIGIEMLKDGIEQYDACGAAQMRGYNLCLLAEAYQSDGQFEEMMLSASHSIDETKRTQIAFYQPEAYRLLGEGLWHLNHDPEESTRTLISAFRLAEQQRSIPLQVRAGHALLPIVDRSQLRRLIERRAIRASESMK